MGGGGGNQQRAAEQAEAQRRADILNTQRRIESIYNTPAREAQIGDLTSDLDKKNLQAQRQSKFALARSGQTMGSLNVDTNKRLSDEYLRGTLEAERRAQGSGNALRQADQSSKLNLFQLAQSGVDMTTAANQAAAQMRQNIGMAQAEATQQGLGDLFGTFGDVYKRSRERAGTERAEKYQYGSFWAPSMYGGGR
jgi:DNA-binding PucR family transcriptional regulator